MAKIKLNWPYAKGEFDTETLEMLCLKARAVKGEIDAEIAIKGGEKADKENGGKFILPNFSIAEINLGDRDSSNILAEEIVRRWNEHKEWHECADDTEDIPQLNTICLLRIEYKEIDTDIVEVGYLTAVWGDYGWCEDYLDNFDKSEYEVKITHWKPISKPKGVEE